MMHNGSTQISWSFIKPFPLQKKRVFHSFFVYRGVSFVVSDNTNITGTLHYDQEITLRH